MAKLGFLLLCTALLAVINEVAGQNKSSRFLNYVTTQRKLANRVAKGGCMDSRTNKILCIMSCPKKCPNDCQFFCPTCRAVCKCELPGNVCGDPRFNGGDGNHFYFHGLKNKDFCIVSDSNLHINAHFIGNHNPSIKRTFTWIQSIGVLFDNHQLYLGAKSAVVWNDDIDHLNITIDGHTITLPLEKSARWASSIIPGLSVSRGMASNGIILELEGHFKIMASAVPISEEESRIHNYGVNKNDSLVHLDLGFKFYNLSHDVQGVLGQTYRPDYVNKMDVRKNMPVMGGAPKYLSSHIFATDCEVSRFSHDSGYTAAF